MLRVIIITEERNLTPSQSIAGVEITCNNPAHTSALLLYKPLPAEKQTDYTGVDRLLCFYGKM